MLMISNRYSHSAFDFIFALQLFQFATQVTPLAGAGGGEGGAGASTGGSTTGGAGAGAGSGTGTAPASINWETAPQQFRDGYNKLKADFERLTNEYKPWQEWATTNKVTAEQLGGIHGTYQQVYEQINGIAEEMGIPEDEVAEAVDKHGVIKVLDHLRNVYAQGQGTGGEGGDQGEGDLDAHIEQALATKLGPIEQRENQRLTDAANSRFEQIVHKSITDAFKAEGVDPGAIPEHESFMLMNATSEILKYDEAALVALKQGQGQAAVQKAFQQAKTFLDNYYLARSGRERAKVGGGGNNNRQQQGQGGNGGKRPTLDEMIEEPTNINPKYKVGT